MHLPGQEHPGLLAGRMRLRRDLRCLQLRPQLLPSRYKMKLEEDRISVISTS
ncbi:hypothetical protein L345_13096, partial [Ophiophagus hannah]